MTWDYRCPFARNAHEHLVVGLEAGAPWDVTFVPFWLTQVHVAEGDPPAWDDPSKERDLLALAAGVVVRDHHPDHFLRVHRALFRARHDAGADLRDPEVVGEALRDAGAPAGEVMDEVREGWAQKAIRVAHEQAVSDHAVFGVPTFIVGEDAVFVRLMNRPGDDAGLARATIDRTIDLAGGWTDLNELKHTTIGH